jgi:hypothetical protein
MVYRLEAKKAIRARQKGEPGVSLNRPSRARPRSAGWSMSSRPSAAEPARHGASHRIRQIDDSGSRKAEQTRGDWPEGEIAMMLADHVWQSTLFLVGAAPRRQLGKPARVRVRVWPWLAEILVPFALRPDR